MAGVPLVKHWWRTYNNKLRLSTLQTIWNIMNWLQTSWWLNRGGGASGSCVLYPRSPAQWDLISFRCHRLEIKYHWTGDRGCGTQVPLAPVSHGTKANLLSAMLPCRCEYCRCLLHFVRSIISWEWSKFPVTHGNAVLFSITYRSKST